MIHYNYYSNITNNDQWRVCRDCMHFLYCVVLYAQSSNSVNTKLSLYCTPKWYNFFCWAQSEVIFHVYILCICLNHACSVLLQVTTNSKSQRRALSKCLRQDISDGKSITVLKCIEIGLPTDSEHDKHCRSVCTDKCG